MENQNIQNVTATQAMDGYFSALQLEHLKSDYDVIRKELSRLGTLDKTLKSTDCKRENIPTLKERQELLKQKYNNLYPVVEEWLKASFPEKEQEKKGKKEKKEKQEILLNYFKDIKTRNLQDIINRLHPPAIICSENKKEGRVVPLYCASNLRQEMHTAWKGQIEGR